VELAIAVFAAIAVDILGLCFFNTGQREAALIFQDFPPRRNSQQ
jgi:hypothetical protein